MPMRKIKKTKANSGETLVEVVASIFIFMIMIGVLQSAISYSSNALKKNKEIRANNEAVLKSLQNAGNSNVTDNKNLEFNAANSAMTVKGDTVVFSVETNLLKQTLNYKDAQGQNKHYAFYTYESMHHGEIPETEDTSGTGGDTP